VLHDPVVSKIALGSWVLFLWAPWRGFGRKIASPSSTSLRGEYCILKMRQRPMNGLPAFLALSRSSGDAIAEAMRMGSVM